MVDDAIPSRPGPDDVAAGDAGQQVDGGLVAVGSLPVDGLPGGEPYQSLYRRYRPQRFSEVRGQEHVTRALLNSVREGRVAHAYLFSGPRGTGKTSTARILAMALNCEHPQDGEPCGTCDSCRGVRLGSSLDVHELDAASNRKLDEMRDLLSRVALGTSGRWKVYIVDEVHQLTSDAASALLKTLEDPPGHVIFVLATTDPQKVLPTIRSRTQHYEFRLLGAEVLNGLLSEVNARAGLGVPPEAIDLVVRRGHGSARDALSVLDQVAALGAVDDETAVVSDIVEGLADRDVGRVLVAVAECMSAGRDPRRLAVDLLDHLRNGFLASQARGLVQLPDDAIAEVESQGRRLGLGTLVRAMEVVGQAATDMRDSADPRVTLEVALVRVASPDADHDPAALLARIERLEQRLASGPVVSNPTAATSGEPAAGGSGPTQGLAEPPAAAPATSSSPPVSSSPPPSPPLGPPAADRGGPPPTAPAPRLGPAPRTPPVMDRETRRPAAPARPAGPGLGDPPPMPRPSLGARRRGMAGTSPGADLDSRPNAEPAAPDVPGPLDAGVRPGGSSGSSGSASAPPASHAASIEARGVEPPTPGRRADTEAQRADETEEGTPAPPPGGQAAGDGPLPSRDELTKAWGDVVLPALPGRLKAYLALGRFVSVEAEAAVYALPDRGLLGRAETVRREFEAALGAHFARAVPVRLVLDEAGSPLPGAAPAPASPPEAEEDDPADYVLADLEDVGAAVVSPEQRLLEAFPGAEEVTP